MTATSYAFQPITLEEWGELDEDDDRELVDGRLVESEMPNHVHEAILTWLTLRLGAWGKPRRARVAGSGLKFGINETRGRMPDMSVLFAGRKRSDAEAAVNRHPPNIAIEVVSRTSRDQRQDRVEKVADYALFGVDWYWIIDPKPRTFEILERGDEGQYRRVVLATEGTIDPVPGCGGLTLDVTDLWREVDEVIAESGDDAEEEPQPEEP